MKKGSFLILSFIFLLLLISGCTINKDSESKVRDNGIISTSSINAGQSLNVNDYNTNPLTECVECQNGKTWNNKPCCTDNFNNDCTAINGVIRWTDLHPAFTTLKGCFQKAPDSGKECALDSDCLSGVCDLESAIKLNKCNLIKKEFSDKKNQFSGEGFYTASYSCKTTKPGVCMESINNRMNPGGKLHILKMNDKTLLESLQGGPIY